MTMSQSLEDIAGRRHGVITRWLASIISGRWEGAADAWTPGVWFAALQRSALQVPWYRKPWLLPSVGCLLFGVSVGALAPIVLPLVIATPYAQIYTMVGLIAMLPALCWHVFHARWYFRRLLDRATFEQLMTTPIGSVSVLKDTLLHLSVQGVPVFLASLIGYLVLFPKGSLMLLDYWAWISFLFFVAGGAGWGVSMALSVPLTAQERTERSAKQLAALRNAAVQFGRFCRQFGVFTVRILLPLAAIAGVGWTVGVTVHPALGWLVAMFGGMAFIVTLLIMASAKQIGTPMPPLPPMPEPGFKDLWEDRLRRYFDREVTA